jgi:hypothetical protein
MFRYVFAGILMLSSAVALADGLSYSYIQASYVDVDIDGENGDGFGVAGGVEIGDQWHVFADYTTASFDPGFGSDIDLDITTAGLGYHHSVSNATDVFAELGFAKVDVQSIGDDSGLLARVGVRHAVSDALELYGSVGNLDFDDFDYGTEFAAGLWYTVSGNLALGLDARFSDNVDRIGASIRLYFDK